MSLFLPRPDFIKPSLRRVDMKHPLAAGMRLCYLLSGWDSREIIRGDLPSYSGMTKSGGDGLKPTHTNSVELFDSQNSSRTPSRVNPRGQGIINLKAGGITPSFTDRLVFPDTELRKFCDYGKPWSFWWSGRMGVEHSGALWAWGVASPDFRGVDLFTQTFGGPYQSVHLINTFSGDAKKLKFEGYTIASFDPATIGFSYTGGNSGSGNTSEFLVCVNGSQIGLSLADGAVAWASSVQPPVGTGLSIFARSTDNPAAGDCNALVFWDRALRAEDFRALQVYGLPLV